MAICRVLLFRRPQGFFPSVYAWSPLVGIWGFILGSAVIGLSQVRAWKVARAW